MESLDLCLPMALSELNLLEQYKLNTLVHHWHDVVGGRYRLSCADCGYQAAPPRHHQRGYVHVDAGITDAETAYHRGNQQLLRS